ncbi:hypothetical protein JM93_01030 [Roseibium hamelinense]|uniref:Uncharacterized protein n=1 Tax=Roseibium hamelinense TaxID=150831 RepID=A0A562TAC3_9HYPH|nr:hypothetical protein [Roseibium hamelinense]MTI45569.1 hypothetical protein [Roseibium hamelinense]TWI90054.1 hypothetical protein JM93_01030 [Roseibium hamelinense]
MVFNTLSFFLLVLAVPLWAYRQNLYLRLQVRERSVFRRIVSKRHEPLWSFGLKLYGALLLAVSIFAAFIYGLRYIKRGDIYESDYNDVIRNRLYSGHDSVDGSLDAVIYDQHFLLVILITCLILTVSIMLALAPARDILIIKKLRSKLQSRTS